jgi:hypothetical protein
MSTRNLIQMQLGYRGMIGIWMISSTAEQRMSEVDEILETGGFRVKEWYSSILGYKRLQMTN